MFIEIYFHFIPNVKSCKYVYREMLEKFGAHQDI